MHNEITITTMKKIIHIITLAAVLPVIMTACTDADERVQPSAPQPYRMILDASFRHYDGVATRAEGYTFQNGDKVHLLFQQAAASVSGSAVYEAASGTWLITPSQTLEETDDGSCRIAFFIDEGQTSGDAVALTQQTRIYTDVEATYQVIDGLLNVQATLSPALGRIRFHGTAGQKCTVAGLSFAGSFNLKTHTFSLSPSKFTATCEADGYTSYFYGAFTDPDTPQLTFVLTAESGLRRELAAGVMQPGTSGYVNIPTADSHEGWTLVNLSGGGEINFPAVATPKAKNVRSTRASLSAGITSDGGGQLSAVGFVIATSHTPTRNNRDLECNVSTSFSSQVSGITPLTTYYVRAYAVNEAGITYSEEISITTPEKNDDDNELDRDDWDRDQNWNDTQNTQATVDRDTYPADEDWN